MTHRVKTRTLNTQVQNDYNETCYNRDWDIMHNTTNAGSKKTIKTSIITLKNQNRNLSGSGLLCWLLDVSSTSSRGDADDGSKAGSSVPGALGIGGTAGNTPVGLHTGTTCMTPVGPH